MAVGDLLRTSGVIAHPVAVPNRIGPVRAMSEALAAYLATLEFRVYGGEDLRDEVLVLAPGAIKDEWPRPDEDLVYPGASIVETGQTKYAGVNLVPFPLEETWGAFDSFVGQPEADPGATVLWKEDAATQDFQVDFWLNNKADRQAVEAGLSAAFAPGEDRSGVVVEGPLLYYSRPVRFSLLGTKNDDTAATAYPNERRLRCTVRGECDIVSLRMAHTVTVQTPCVEVTDPNDPPPEDS